MAGQPLSPWRVLRRTLWVIIAVLPLILGAVHLGRSWFGSHDHPLAVGARGIPFTLTDHTGRTVQEKDFAGRYLALYFGFTRCPDICPTSLTALSEIMTALGPQADRLTPIFITVDPERDTIELMRDYVGAFDPRTVGLTGSATAIAKLAQGWGIYYRKVPTSQGDYTMDHSASIYLMGPDYRLRAILDLHSHPEDITPALTKIRAVMAE